MKSPIRVIKFLITLSALVLASCSSPPSPKVIVNPAAYFQVGEKVEFHGYEIAVNAAILQDYFTNWFGQKTVSGSRFTVVEVQFMNKTGVPQPQHFQPIFRLIDKSGAIYEPDPMNTIAANISFPGRFQAGQNLNPNVRTKYHLIFEVPSPDMTLQVMVPNEVERSFGGSAIASGAYYLVDLSEELKR